MTVLSKLLPGQKAIVTKVNGNGLIRRRIVAMGIIPGTVLEVQKLAPLGDPMEVKVKDFNLSIRKEEAAQIEVDPGKGG